jgi:selenocysteine lyase/cysteine desulfurase
VNRHFARRDDLACSDFLDWYTDHDRLRELIGRLIQTPSEGIAFIPNAASALSLLIGAIDWKAGDRIVTLENEFPNNIYHPALLAERGVEFIEVPWSRLYESVNERTRLVAVSMLSYVNGFRPPLAELGRFLTRRGILFYLDGTQGLGALQLNIGEIQPDLFAVHGYKWMLAPNGAAFMYVAPNLRNQLRPNVVGWRSHAAWLNVDNLHHGAPVFDNSAEKYEGAGLASALLYAFAASVEMMLEIGPTEIERRVLDLAAKARHVLAERGATVPEGEFYDSPIIAGKFDCCDASAVAVQLEARRVLVSARQGNLRVSTHFYNNENDLDRLNEELKRALPKMVSAKSR